MLIKEPEQRITPFKALNHPLFDHIKSSLLEEYKPDKKMNKSEGDKE